MATHDSPAGHPVEVVIGNADAVEDRGTQIVNLGSAMTDASSLLTRLVDSGADMEGHAVDTLREVSGEVTAELGRAASLYVSVGPYVKNYGTALSTVQSLMTTSVRDANSAWVTYQTKLSDWGDARSRPVDYPSGTSSSEDGSEREAAEQAHADDLGDAETAKDNAYEQWVLAGDTFDGHYDQWQDAFDTAVAGIRTQNDDGIEDSWRDDLDGFVDVALDVLAVAGVVLAVLALVVGGPIVALLAIVVGVLSLVGTVWQYQRGDAAMWEVGLAVLGVIPFGALGEFASGGFGAGMRAWGGLSHGGLSLGDDAARWGLSLSSASPAQWVSNMRGLGPEAGFVVNSFDEIVSSVITGQDPFMWEVIGELATPAQSMVYGISAAGAHYNDISTVVSGVSGVIGLVKDAARMTWPTW